MKTVTILGARPQFIKASPLCIELRKQHKEVLVHTGQHYDHEMSAVFFEELGIPAPDYHLGIGGGYHGAQTGAMLAAVEQVLIKEMPDIVIVFGDTNSTLAGALAAVKLHIPVAHVEAGLRSFNRAMPEEINRIVTDHVASLLFVPSEISKKQLEREGITDGVHIVGDIMADAVRINSERAQARSTILDRLHLRYGEYYLATVHRPENADVVDNLRNILYALSRLDKQVILPLHPRTKKRVQEFGLQPERGLTLIDPVGYLDMLKLQGSAACVLTDSGGIQKEAYYLGIPCVTLRNETEWVETVDAGWNVLCGADPDRIVVAVEKMSRVHGWRPDLYGDGMAAKRIVQILTEANAKAIGSSVK